MENLRLLKPDESMKDEFLHFNQGWAEHQEEIILMHQI